MVVKDTSISSLSVAGVSTSDKLKLQLSVDYHEEMSNQVVKLDL
jgi:hypothetical protein